MANWSDPRSAASPYGAAGARAEAVDAGLRSYMLSVYNYMTSAVLLTAIVSMLMSWGGESSLIVQILRAGGSLVMWVLALAPLGIVMAMSFGQGRFSTGTLQLMFWAYAGLIGVSLSTIFLVYTQTSIALAFFSAAAGFAGLSLWGYTTKRDLSAFGTFLIVGLVGLIVAMLINLFVQSSVLSLIISIVGVLVFAGLAAYDTQKIKSIYFQVAGTEWQGKAVIMGALNLYIDFINMFMFILRLVGSNRN